MPINVQCYALVHNTVIQKAEVIITMFLSFKYE